MVCIRITGWLICFALVAGSPVSAQRKLERMTPTALALQLSSELDKDSYDHEEAVQAIFSSYLLRGDYRAAINTLSTLDHPGRQSQGLLYLTGIATKAGRNEEARAALDLALKLILEQAEDSRDIRLISAFVQPAVDLGELKLASRFIELLGDDARSKVEAFLSLSRAFQKRGEKEPALSAANTALEQLNSLQADEPYGFSKLTPKVTKVLAELGDLERAAELIKRAELTPAPEKDLNQDCYKEFLSEALMSIGAFERSLSLTESFEGAAKSESLIALALAYGEKGNGEAGLSSLRYARDNAETDKEIDDSSKARVFGLLVGAYLKLGRPDEALLVLRQLHTPFHLVESTVEVAEAYRAIGRNQDAVAALDVAVAKIRNVISERSEEIPPEASGSKAREKSMGLSILVEAYLDLNNVAGAENAGLAIDQPQFKASLLAQVAAAYHKNGNEAKARSLLSKALHLSANAKEYRQDRQRKETLLQIAEAYADAGYTREAGEVVLTFLTELRDMDDDGQTIGGLINIGHVCEKAGIPMTKRAQAVLMTIVKNFRAD